MTLQATTAKCTAAPAPPVAKQVFVTRATLAEPALPVVGHSENPFHGSIVPEHLIDTEALASLLGIQSHTVRQHTKGSTFSYAVPGGKLATITAYRTSPGSSGKLYFDPAEAESLKAKLDVKNSLEPVDTVARIVGLTVLRVMQMIKSNSLVFSYQPIEGNELRLQGVKAGSHQTTFLFKKRDVAALERAVALEKKRCMIMSEATELLATMGTPVTQTRLTGLFDSDVRVFTIDGKNYAVAMKRDYGRLYAGKPTRYLYREEVELISAFLKSLENLTSIADAERRFGLHRSALRERDRLGKLATQVHLGEHYVAPVEMARLEEEFARKTVPESAVRLHAVLSSFAYSSRAIRERGVERDLASANLYLTGEDENGSFFRVRVYEDVHKRRWIAKPDFDRLKAIDSKFGSGGNYETLYYWKDMCDCRGYGIGFAFYPNLVKDGVIPQVIPAAAPASRHSKVHLPVILRAHWRWVKASDVLDYLLKCDPSLAANLAKIQRNNRSVLSRNYAITVPATNAGDVTAEDVELLLLHRTFIARENGEEMALKAMSDLIEDLSENDTLTHLEQAKLWLARNYFVTHNFSSKQTHKAADTFLHSSHMDMLFSIPLPSNSRFFRSGASFFSQAELGDIMTILKTDFADDERSEFDAPLHAPGRFF